MKIKNNQKYNSILIVICHITKYALFILIQNDITIADFAEFFFKHVEYHFSFRRREVKKVIILLYDIVTEIIVL